MSRRSHYRSGKPSRAGQHGAAATAASGTPAGAARPPSPFGPLPPVRDTPPAGNDVGHLAQPSPEPRLPEPGNVEHAIPVAGHGSNGHAPEPNGHAPEPHGRAANGHRLNGQGPLGASDGQPGASTGCTAPQLRRFIKSRSWVPMHELRRRFAINGSEDDVTPVSVEGSTIFVGLPSREGRLLGELFHGGDIGYELSMDPCTPIVIGVYPMRPVPRH
jgi:hypothetical protein